MSGLVRRTAFACGVALLSLGIGLGWVADRVGRVGMNLMGEGGRG